MPGLQDVIARGQSRWQQYLQNLQGWTPPDQEAMEMQFQDARDLARGYVNNMLDATGARQLLSPFYVNMLKRNALRPFVQQSVLSSAEYGLPDPGNFGDFLKNWIGMNPSGVGNIGDYRGRMQQLLNRIQAGRQAEGTADAAVADRWLNNPEIMSAALGMGARGIFRDYVQRQIQDALEAGQAQGPGIDWLEYLLARVPGTGYTYQGPS